MSDSVPNIMNLLGTEQGGGAARWDWVGVCVGRAEAESGPQSSSLCPLPASRLYFPTSLLPRTSEVTPAWCTVIQAPGTYPLDLASQKYQ